jgi:hypothetical protein
LLVVSGGYTEDAYLRGLARHHSNRSVALTLKTCPVAPAQVVDYARRLADHHNDEFDEVWCVVDVDDFDIHSGISRAAELNAELVVSNPCFELWLLLHFEPLTSHLAKCKDVERMIRRHLPTYRKAKLSFIDFEAGLAQACQRARHLEMGDVNHPNPSTGIWRLVERIMTQEAQP